MNTSIIILWRKHEKEEEEKKIYLTSPVDVI